MAQTATAGPSSGSANDPETQYVPLDNSQEEEVQWGVKRLLGENTIKKLYLVEWEDIDEETGYAYEPSWQPKEGCTQDLIDEWKAQVRADPKIRGPAHARAAMKEWRAEKERVLAEREKEKEKQRDAARSAKGKGKEQERQKQKAREGGRDAKEDTERERGRKGTETRDLKGPTQHKGQPKKNTTGGAANGQHQEPETFETKSDPGDGDYLDSDVDDAAVRVRKQGDQTGGKRKRSEEVMAPSRDKRVKTRNATNRASSAVSNNMTASNARTRASVTPADGGTSVTHARHWSAATPTSASPTRSATGMEPGSASTNKAAEDITPKQKRKSLTVEIDVPSRQSALVSSRPSTSSTPGSTIKRSNVDGAATTPTVPPLRAAAKEKEILDLSGSHSSRPLARPKSTHSAASANAGSSSSFSFPSSRLMAAPEKPPDDETLASAAKGSAQSSANGATANMDPDKGKNRLQPEIDLDADTVRALQAAAKETERGQTSKDATQDTIRQFSSPLRAEDVENAIRQAITPTAKAKNDIGRSTVSRPVSNVGGSNTTLKAGSATSKPAPAAQLGAGESTTTHSAGSATAEPAPVAPALPRGVKQDVVHRKVAMFPDDWIEESLESSAAVDAGAKGAGGLDTKEVVGARKLPAGVKEVMVDGQVALVAEDYEEESSIASSIDPLAAPLVEPTDTEPKAAEKDTPAAGPSGPKVAQPDAAPVAPAPIMVDQAVQAVSAGKVVEMKEVAIGGDEGVETTAVVTVSTGVAEGAKDDADLDMLDVDESESPSVDKSTAGGAQPDLGAAESSVKSVEDQLAAAQAEIAELRRFNESLVNDHAFIKQQYDHASSRAVEEAASNDRLRDKLAIQKRQLVHSLAQKDAHYKALLHKDAAEVDRLRVHNKLLMDQSRRTDDAVRARAAQYAAMHRKYQPLELEAAKLRDRVEALKSRNEALLDQLEYMRARQMGVIQDVDPENDEDEDGESGSETDMSSDDEGTDGGPGLDALGYAVRPAGMDSSGHTIPSSPPTTALGIPAETTRGSRQATVPKTEEEVLGPNGVAATQAPIIQAFECAWRTPEDKACGAMLDTRGDLKTHWFAAHRPDQQANLA